MKFSNIFLLFNLLLLSKHVIIANQELPKNPLHVVLRATNDTSNGNKSSKDSEPFTIILLVGCMIGLVVIFFLFIIYMKKYKALQEILKQNNILPRENSYNDKDDLEKNMEIVVRDPNRQVQGEDGVGGNLVLLREEIKFEVDDLLKASAEGLGKGNFGNCYKAMLEKGPIVVVKRLKELKPMSKEEFVKQVKGIASLRHPNLLPILGFYYSNEEKLLLFKFAPNGNAYNRLHDGRGNQTRVPFRWNSRLAVARGVARALAYLHINMKLPDVIPHGNLKLTNVLLDENDAVLVTDYGLTAVIAGSLAAQRMAAFKSPEFQTQKKVTRKSDVRSYGCLLLELLTGKLSQDPALQPQGDNNNNNNGVELCSWVHRAVREEWTAEIFDVEISSRRNGNGGMVRLLQIAMRCCERSPEKRPEMSEVVREVEKIAVAADSEDEENGSIEKSFTDDSRSASAGATPSRSINTGDDEYSRSR